MKIQMRRYLNPIIWVLILSTTIQIQTAWAQILEPVSWQARLEPNTPLTAGQSAKIIFEASIEKNWYLYSSDFDPDLGPVISTFTFSKSDQYSLIGKIKPIGAKRKIDDVFGGEVRYFVGKAVFEQSIKILKPTNQTIKIHYEGQACSDINGTCVPIEEDLSINIVIKPSAQISEIPKKNSAATAVPIITKTLENNNQIEARQSGLDTIKLATKAPLAEINKPKKLVSSPDTALSLPKSSNATGVGTYQISGSDKPLWQFALLAFLSGLLALLTPCVFPLIPMTVSYFSRSASKFQALLYGFFIVLIYSLAGVMVALFNGPDLLNLLSTHWLPNVLFFIAFVIFGISFLGAFEISLPASWANNADQRAEKGGVAGVFFMALTLVIVSFSCTGPIVGAVLLQAAGGQMLKPIVGMAAFAFSFAIPFTLFAFFPQWLSKLPRSGSWLNSVKVVLGFVELGLAFKFLSVADQAYHWQLLNRDVYLVIWISLSLLTFLYLIGSFRLPHDGQSSENHIGVLRVLVASIFLGFGIYLVPGLWGAPLQPLSGYLPPMHTAGFDISKQSLNNKSSNIPTNICQTPLYSDFLHWPHGLNGYFDYEQALACAKQLGKPVFIDFTGHGCVNCREMEARVWADPKVLSRLQTDFVLLALYVDDKTDLPKEKVYISQRDGKEKNTIGRQNADFQISRFGANAQPFYVIIDPNGKILVEPRAYNLDAAEFVLFLDEAKRLLVND